MLINPLKAFLFVACGAGAAAGTAYVSGALDPYLAAPGRKTWRWLRSTKHRPPKAGASTPNQDRRRKMPPFRRRGPPASRAPPTQPKAPRPRAPWWRRSSTSCASNRMVRSWWRARPRPNRRSTSSPAPMCSARPRPPTAAISPSCSTSRWRRAAHELVLRATGEDKVVATSEETAVVSVPETKDGQVLALVERPGEPSKLITVPSPQKVASNADPGKQARPGAATMDKAPGAPAAGAPAAATPAASPEQQSAARETAVTPAPRVEPATPGRTRRRRPAHRRQRRPARLNPAAAHRPLRLNPAAAPPPLPLNQAAAHRPCRSIRRRRSGRCPAGRK